MFLLTFSFANEMLGICSLLTTSFVIKRKAYIFYVLYLCIFNFIMNKTVLILAGLVGRTIRSCYTHILAIAMHLTPK